MIECKLCGYWYYSITTGHLRVAHGLSGVYEYLRLFPGAETRSKETKQLVSEGVSRVRLGQSLPSQSVETKLLRGRSMRAFWKGLSPKDKAWRLAVSFHQEGALERVGDTLRGIPRSGDCCRQIGESQRKFWAGLSLEERLERVRNSFLSEEAKLASQEASHKCPNRCEQILWEFLEEHYPGMFIPTWVEHIEIGGKFPDFVSRNGYKILIETMGEYRHDGEDEEDRITLYRTYGWKCLVVWADNPEDIIVEWPTLKQRILVEMEL